MRYYYWTGVEGNIHVREPYLLEKSLFGITEGGVRLTPNEYLDRHAHPIFDLCCGFAYLTFVAEYLFLAFFLFFRRQDELANAFGWCFFGVNVAGFITYFLYPAAPPWYVSEYGLGPARTDVAPSAAAAGRFDSLLGTHFFDEMYGRGIDVFGAYPSLHVSYPLLVALIAFKLGAGRIPAVGFYLLMCFSAVYLQHHYVVDVLLGSGYAFATWMIWTWVSREKQKPTDQLTAYSPLH
jgi:inositol phosphorylceramide synthase catalytic subunit